MNPLKNLWRLRSLCGPEPRGDSRTAGGPEAGHCAARIPPAALLSEDNRPPVNDPCVRIHEDARRPGIISIERNFAPDLRRVPAPLRSEA
jgi:hypothetical protein